MGNGNLPSNTVTDLYIAAFLSTKSPPTPILQDGRVAWRFKEDVSADIRAFYDGATVGANAFARELRQLRSHIYSLKNGGGAANGE